MKRGLVIGVVIVIVIIAGLYLYPQNGSIEQNTLSGNILTLNDFQYTYDSKVSHSCPGTTETLSFLYNGENIEISAQQRSWHKAETF